MNSEGLRENLDRSIKNSENIIDLAFNSDPEFEYINENVIDSDNETVRVISSRNSLLNISDSKINYLQKIRKLNIFKRIFRKFREGSLRGTILTWVRMTLGIGIFSLPFYVSKLGALTGALFILLAAFLNFFTFHIIFDIAQKTNKKTYISIVRNTLGFTMYKISRITLLLDYISTMLLYTVAGYNFLENILFNFDILKDSDLSNKEQLKFKEYSPKMIMIRSIFFTVIYLVSIPNLLNKKMESMRSITLGFLLLLIILLLTVLIQLPFFFKYYNEKNELEIEWFFKNPSINWITCYFSIMFSFNLQIYALDIKQELLYPSKKRLNKINKYSHLFEAILCTIVGITGYICLGDNYITSLFILRKPLDPNSPIEIVIRILIILFFIFIIISLPIFNPSVRNYLGDFFHVKVDRYFKSFSLIPFLCVCILSAFLPFITDILDVFGLTFFNYDAYIVPLMMKISYMRFKKESNGKIFFYVLLLLIIVVLSGLGLFNAVLGYFGYNFN